DLSAAEVVVDSPDPDKARHPIRLEGRSSMTLLRTFALLILIAIACGLVLGAGTPGAPAGTAAPKAAAPKAAAAKKPDDPVHAGLLLFNDPSLSGAGTVSCATCHPRGGHTNNKTYVGLNVVPDGTPDGRSVP